MIGALGKIASREIALTWGAGGSGFLPAAFFFGAVMIAPFAVGPDPRLLGAIGPGYLWLALALATLVSLERLFQADLEDGTLDQLVLQPVPLSLVVLAKALGQWLAVAGPILLVVPVAAVMLKVAPAHIGGLLAQLVAGSLALFLVGTIGAALGASVRRGGLLVALIALPLYAPVLIFGAGAAEVLVKTGELFSQPFLLVLALALGALALVPLAAGAALRLHVD
ncbi:MAG: heme exporter protein CcmB [Hyphomonadaceae bacterium]|jgi:heme exporter protein B|nr:heme exporter protein CcmB [Hyphomonadaceae bacterium]